MGLWPFSPVFAAVVVVAVVLLVVLVVVEAATIGTHYRAVHSQALNPRLALNSWTFSLILSGLLAADTSSMNE